MIDFEKYPILGILVYGLLLISCLLELSVELGMHEFDDFASHHGLAIFALGSLFANWDDMSKSLKDFKNQKRKETKISVTIIVKTWVDFIARPSFNPVISLNSPALIKNFFPSKNLLSEGPIIIRTTACVTNITPILTIANCTGGLLLNR